MTIRSISGIVFAIIVAVEIYLYLNTEVAQKFIPGQKIGNSMFTSKNQLVTDYDAEKRNDNKYMIIIGATILVGGIATFSLPNSKIKFNQETEETD